MKRMVCNYAPVRFLPYRETGEFVNIGVVLFCPQLNIFTYRLATRRHKRISDFFPELDVKILKAAVQSLRLEMEQLPFQRIELTNALPGQNWEITGQINRFTELIRIREGIIHFGTPGTLLASTPEIALDQLYQRYVTRLFAKRVQYQEREMRKILHAHLHKWNLSAFYQYDKTIGDEDFHFKVPFVYFKGNKPEKVIKPLDLNKATASEIYDHAGVWIERINRLKKRSQLPSDVIFPIALPIELKKLAIAKDVCKEMQDLGVSTTPYSSSSTDIEQIHGLATRGIPAATDWLN